jgi:hypothetical protein
MVGTERYTPGQIDSEPGRHKDGWQFVRQPGKHVGRQGSKK